MVGGIETVVEGTAVAAVVADTDTAAETGVVAAAGEKRVWGPAEEMMDEAAVVAAAVLNTAVVNLKGDLFRA